jgi:hypothetical protein
LFSATTDEETTPSGPRESPVASAGSVGCVLAGEVVALVVLGKKDEAAGEAPHPATTTARARPRPRETADRPRRLLNPLPSFIDT